MLGKLLIKKAQKIFVEISINIVKIVSLRYLGTLSFFVAVLLRRTE